MRGRRVRFHFSGLCLLLALPVLSEVTVVGGMTREKTVKPGETFEGIVLLRNSGEEAVEVKIYQTDYLFFADGRNVFGKPGELPRSNARWVTLGRNFQTIPPKESVGVSYSVKVPDQADLKGTYWSMVMVESAGKPPELKEKGEKDVRLGIRHVMRYGVQLVTHLGDSGEIKVKVADKSLVYEEGKPFLRVDIENEGERWLRPEVWVELYDSKGKSFGQRRGQKKRIYPGTSIRQDLDLSELPAGKYKGLIVIDNGDDNLFGARAKFELKAPAPEETK